MATKKVAKSKQEAFAIAWDAGNDEINKKIEAARRKRKAAAAKRKKSSK